MNETLFVFENTGIYSSLLALVLSETNWITLQTLFFILLSHL